MTDNRATELREKLDELGIEHTDASYKLRTPITAWTVDDATFCYVEDFESTDLHIDNATPEQAIAATLGNPNCGEIDNLLRNFGADCAHELNADPDETVSEATIAKYVNAIAATLGSEREKALEELVRDAYWLIVRADWTHESQDQFAFDWTERVAVLGIEVD